ncbi:hypothetical protein [Nonomuraea sp. SBT364]|uniref:hypothetical protein n=1 Tax=Nonomuraea sp. SBT364 TaxID=1580530 RepID=UPI00066B8D91|nr:hypothetical protein [Nonomuraea sp. SBT364]
MTEHKVPDEMRRVLDEVFRDRDEVTRRELYSCASGHIQLSADMLGQLNELPERSYTRQELTEAIDRLIEGGPASRP